MFIKLYYSLRRLSYWNYSAITVYPICEECNEEDFEYNPKYQVATCLQCQSQYTYEELKVKYSPKLSKIRVMINILIMLMSCILLPLAIIFLTFQIGKITATSAGSQTINLQQAIYEAELEENKLENPLDIGLRNITEIPNWTKEIYQDVSTSVAIENIEKDDYKHPTYTDGMKLEELENLVGMPASIEKSYTDTADVMEANYYSKKGRGIEVGITITFLVKDHQIIKISIAGA